MWLLSDDPRVGAPPKTAVTQENVDAVRKLIIEDRHVTYREIEAVNWCQKTLDGFNSGNSKNVYSIVSDDESWIYCEEKPTTVIRSRSVSELPKINSERRIILHQDNASSHTAQKTSPNDFFTFPKIKNRPRGQSFQSPEEAVDAFKNAWNKCFENWFERMQMCINLRGEYFEKQ
ncbi:unnamed protein product [Acanthoscelides obtectus]|uniref:Transposase n=1 Tax=Acanthoscelides obtectus TaxID=200917 RepID=A0A9P0LJV0_ACAOB|nr:unnamed protein product [Acanthoscelides obtectus]CAK1649776.1 hypothetical protein AOBTE_LOCUS16425 [Acanthoscelides obtectus]